MPVPHLLGPVAHGADGAARVAAQLGAARVRPLHLRLQLRHTVLFLSDKRTIKITILQSVFKKTLSEQAANTSIIDRITLR